MKKINIYPFSIYLRLIGLYIFCIAITATSLNAQDSTIKASSMSPKKAFTKNTFAGNLLIDNQTVMVPIKGTFEFVINHRFAPMNNGFKDLFGVFGSANMRLGFSYVPIKNLQLGFGANNYNMIVDGNLKYALLKQTTDNSMPISLTYLGALAMDTRARNSSLPIVTTSDRFSYFNQLIVARKFTEAFSVQGGFSYSHFNNIEGYYDANKVIQSTLLNDHLAFSLGGRFKISPKTAIIFNYDQPLTQHPTNNPNPNLSLGIDMNSSGHSFQVFFGNYGLILPQYNNMFNQNDFIKGQYVIGFNIGRLWNF